MLASRTRTAWTICKTGSSGPTSTPWLRSAQRETATGTTVHSRYYISSLARPAQTLLEVTRRHWCTLHWSLDTFREDLRKDNGPQNLAVLRQIALNLLKQETSLKRGLQGKRLKAGWVEDYLLKVLLG